MYVSVRVCEYVCTYIYIFVYFKKNSERYAVDPDQFC